MIKYNDIYEALRKEKYSEQLQPLSKKFISEISSYISEKKKLSSKEGEFFSEETLKIRKQIENTISIFEELMVIRKKKMLGLVFVASETGINKRDFENMLDFEKDMFDSMVGIMKDAEKKLSLQFSNQNEDNIKDKELKLLMFLVDIEEFVSFDGITYGPFKKGDIINISKQIADILVDDKKAEIVSDD